MSTSSFARFSGSPTQISPSTPLSFIPCAYGAQLVGPADGYWSLYTTSQPSFFTASSACFATVTVVGRSPVRMPTCFVDAGNFLPRYRYSPIAMLSIGFGSGCTTRSAPRASAVTTWPAMSGSRHWSRVWTPWLSNTAPPPTRKKSCAQASVMRALTSNRAESCWLTTILRPLMPPAALHHLLNTSAVSKSSWSRPGRPTKPGSANVPTLISVGVTPCAVAPVASPDWQTSFRVPKSPEAGVLGPAGVLVVEEAGPPSESLRPQAASSSAAPRAHASHRLGIIDLPGGAGVGAPMVATRARRSQAPPGWCRAAGVPRSDRPQS